MAKQQGTVTNYNSKRGFGFVSPKSGGDDVFVHWADIKTDDRWPKLEKDQVVQFTVETDENGKVRAKNVTIPGGGKVTVTSDDKQYGDFRYPGVVKWFRGWTGKEGGFGFITLGMEAVVGDETVADGDDVYVSREELFVENPLNPKVCAGMDVEFLVAKTSYGKFCACEVTLPGGTPIGDLPEREPREPREDGDRPRKGKGKGKGKGESKGKGKAKGAKAGKGKGGVQKAIVKTPTPAAPAPSKGKGAKGAKGAKGKGKAKGERA